MIFLSLCSCQQSDLDFERSTFSIGDQQFEVLTADGIFDDYRDKPFNYTRRVFDKIEREFGPNAEYSFLLEGLKKEIRPNDSLWDELKLLKQFDFAGMADSTFRIVAQKLQGPDTKILFLPANPEYRALYRKFGVGLHAITLGAGKIIVSIDPTFPDWPRLLPYALAHEYHHSVWTSRHFLTADFTPLEYLILEGRAESFAMGLFPNDRHPFIDMLTDSQERRIWGLIKPELHKRKSPMNDLIMYGTDEIPYGSVYAIGFSILKSFKQNNPSIGDDQLLDLPPEEVLRLSGYDDTK